MKTWTLIGLLLLLPSNNGARAADYDPNLCEAFAHNMDPPFSVPAGGQCRMTIDMTHCGGLVQNYQITLMSEKRSTPYATMECRDQSGHYVGVYDPGHHVVYLGTVPSDAVYTIEVTSGSRRSESCRLYYSGAI